VLVLALLLSLGRAAAAEPRAGQELAATANLDGLYLAAGPLGGGAVSQDGWTGTFGGEVILVRVRERRPLAALGLVAGAVRYADVERGRLSVDLLAGTRRPFGVALGIQAGGLVEVDEIRRPRPGVQGTLWLYAGILPYVRAGTIQETGAFFELGLRIPLPAFRW
jgi:hypothetical protein